MIRTLTLTACLFLSHTFAAIPPVDSKSFWIVAYNLENLFDIDGRSEFNDYKMAGEEGADDLPYTPAMLMSKLAVHARVLKTLGDGTGPEIILFQEFERDRTPESGITSPSDFLRSRLGRTPLSTLLQEPIGPNVSGLPSYAFMLKALQESGMGPYYVATPYSDPDLPANHPRRPHINAVFSKFPITKVRAHVTKDAREILEAHLSIHGRKLIVFCNHWKSGASNPDTEPTRVANATTLRNRIDELLEANPQVEIVVGGDLNTYYNQKTLFGFETAAINDVLRSIGDEIRMEDPAETALYNLWYELPVDRRYTEVWRGMYGNLMHLLVTNGLYDRRGISYVDDSFCNLILPGLNTDHWGRPLEWRKTDTGGNGASDHLPILARFRVVIPGQEDESYTEPRMIDYSLDRLPSGYTIRDLNGSLLYEVAARPWAYRGEIFRVQGTRIKGDEPSARIDNKVFQIWSPNEELLKKFRELRLGTSFETHAEVVRYRGKPEIVILDPSWVVKPTLRLSGSENKN